MIISKELIFPIFALLLVFSVFFFVDLKKTETVKLLDCLTAPDVYFLKPSEISSIQPILKSNENALVVIPETNEVRANTKLLECPGIDLEKYIWGVTNG